MAAARHELLTGIVALALVACGPKKPAGAPDEDPQQDQDMPEDTGDGDTDGGAPPDAPSDPDDPLSNDEG